MEFPMKQGNYVASYMNTGIALMDHSPKVFKSAITSVDIE